MGLPILGDIFLATAETDNVVQPLLVFSSALVEDTTNPVWSSSSSPMLSACSFGLQQLSQIVRLGAKVNFWVDFLRFAQDLTSDISENREPISVRVRTFGDPIKTQPFLEKLQRIGKPQPDFED